MLFRSMHSHAAVVSVQGKTKGTGQQTLDASFKRVDVLKGFTQDGILHAVAKFVAVDDQVHSSSILGNVD